MNKDTVILFYPKTEEDNLNKNIPLAYLKLGSELKRAGYEVVIIDERFEDRYEDKLADALKRCVFFGVSAMTGHQIKGGLKASSFVKEKAGDVPVVWGGWHASILPEETLKNNNIDILVRGQGEVTTCRLCDTLSDKKDLKDIEGISYKENGSVISNRGRKLHDLNEFCPTRFDVLDVERYIHKGPLGERSIFWNSSQGCPYRCGFCSTATVFKRRWSGLKAETLLEQLKRLANDYNIDGVTFAEDNFFVDTLRVEKLCQGLIRNNLKIKWATDARIDQLNRFSGQFLDLLRISGCSKLYVGAESGDEEVLHLIDKKIKIEDTYRSAEKLARHNIISEFFMIVGFPTNPQRDFENSFKMIKNIKSDYPDHQFTVFLYTPYPGTPLLELSVKNGLRIPKRLEDWADWSILSVNTPWVDKRYLDLMNMYSKCFYLLAFPSSSLREKFKKRFGLLYRILHISSRFRVKNKLFLFPIEWKLIKIFYRLKMRFNLFKNIESFR